MTPTFHVKHYVSLFCTLVEGTIKANFPSAHIPKALKVILQPTPYIFKVTLRPLMHMQIYGYTGSQIKTVILPISIILSKG